MCDALKRFTYVCVPLVLFGCAAAPLTDESLLANGTLINSNHYYASDHLYQLFIAERAAPARAEPPRLGLALAGGGTKAAGFAMGVLQGMEVAGRMHNVDILSTVSGGGYAGYWYYSRLVQDTGDAFNTTGRFDPDVLKPFFADCLPSRYKEIIPAGNTFALAKVCPKENFTNYLGSSGGDPFRYQNYLRGYQDVFSTGRNLFGGRAFNYETTDVDTSFNNEIVENTGLTAFSMVLNVLPNMLFDWQLNVSSTQRAYAKGIARTYGARPPLCTDNGEDDGCLRPWSWRGEIRLEGDIDKARTLTFENIRDAYERKKAPLWIINSTAGEDRSVFDTGPQKDLIFTSFEFTPYGYGSGLYGYWPGELQGMTPTEAVVSSAAFFDDQQKGEMTPPIRNLAAALMKFTTLSWGTSYRNPNVDNDVIYHAHKLLPFPLYYAQSTRGPSHSTYIHLSDGGQSENLGAYALIRRGVPNIIIADHAQDRGGQMHDVCRLKNQIRKQGLSLRLPGLKYFLQQCNDSSYIEQGYDVFNWRHPVLLGCVVSSNDDDDSCEAPTAAEQAAGKYFARLFVIKPSLGSDSVSKPLMDMAKVCLKGDSNECNASIYEACTQTVGTQSPLWKGAAPASCEMYGFISKNRPGTSGIADDKCPQFPQYGTVAMTIDSSPWMYGALRDLAAYYAERVATLFDADGKVKQELFNEELMFQKRTAIPRQPLGKQSLLFTPKAGAPGQCFGLGGIST